jgi:hypothetical protein
VVRWEEAQWDVELPQQRDAALVRPIDHHTLPGRRRGLWLARDGTMLDDLLYSLPPTGVRYTSTTSSSGGVPNPDSAPTRFTVVSEADNAEKTRSA